MKKIMLLSLLLLNLPAFSNELDRSLELNETITEAFIVSKMYYGGDSTKELIRKTIEETVPFSDFHGDVIYFKEYRNYLYMCATGRKKDYDRYNLEEVSENWLRYYNSKMEILFDLINQTGIRARENFRKSYQFMQPVPKQNVTFDHWWYSKD